MPIKGLSEQLRLPRLGKIHLGVKVTNERGVEYPKAVDHFVVPPEVAAVYGEEPKELDIMFPVDEPERVASQYFRAYSQGRGLLAKGDGERAMWLVDLDKLEQTGEVTLADASSKRVEMREVPCTGRACPYYQRRMCRELMMLQFLLPKVPGLGVWQIDTSSVISIVQINSALHLLRSIAGRVSAIDLKLVIEPREVSPNGRKKTVHVLNIRLPNLTLYEMVEMAKKLGTKPDLLLPPAEDEAPELLYPTEEQRQAQAEAEALPAVPTAPVVEAAIPVPVPPPVKAKPASLAPEQMPRSLGELFTMSWKDYKLYKRDTLAKLGYSSELAIVDPAAEWVKLKAIMEAEMKAKGVPSANRDI